MISNKRILITGGAGFIGASLIGCLMDKNIITVLDTFNRNTLGSMAYKRHPNLKVVHGSVLDPIILEEVVKDQQIIVHCAAIAGIDTVAKQPSDTMRINMIGTANLFEAARHIEGLERVINFSTSEVFGGTAFNSAYHRQYGLPTVTVRPFNIYGPGQIGEGAMHVFIRKALKNEDLCIFGEGVQIRAWCYIDDMINALKETITNPKALGESFNIGNGRAVITVLGLAQTVCRVLNSKSKIVFRKPLTSDIELRIPSLKKAKKFIGFNAEVDLEEGIQRTAQWYVKHEKALPELPSMFN
jgi:UDP-glucose 4-epimerase